MPEYDVYGVGNALVDIEYEVAADMLNTLEVDKGLMTLIELDRHHELVEKLSDHEGKKCSGGSAANTIIGAASLGAQCYYSCKVANDDTGTFYMLDLEASGVSSNLNMDNRESGTTGKCLVMITPDADRTMNTFLGITREISEKEVSPEAIQASQYAYIEGYLVPEPNARAAAIKVREIAEQANVRTALTLSDPNMVNFFRDGLLDIAGDNLDLCFSNEEEAKLMFEADTIEDAIEGMKTLANQFAITLGPAGSLLYDGNSIIQIDGIKAEAIDTNGAGDIYAGSFLYGITHGMSFEQAGDLANRAAAKLVTRYGARLDAEEMKKLLA